MFWRPMCIHFIQLWFIGVTLIVMGESAQVQFARGFGESCYKFCKPKMLWGCFKAVSGGTEQYNLHRFSNNVNWRHIFGSGIDFVFTISLAYIQQKHTPICVFQFGKKMLFQLVIAAMPAFSTNSYRLTLTCRQNWTVAQYGYRCRTLLPQTSFYQVLIRNQEATDDRAV